MNTTIEIEGVKYEVNLNKAIDTGLIKEVYVPKSKGQYFKNRFTCNLYLLASTGCENTMALINTSTGDFFRPAVEVINHGTLTEQEWKSLTGGSRFTQVNVNTVPAE